MADLDLELHAPIGQDLESDYVDLSAAVSGIRGSTKRKEIRSVPAAQISEFAINSSSEKVKLHELLGSVDSSVVSGQLKNELRNVHKRQKVLETPLNRLEKGALSRSAAYEQTCKEVSKWQPIVNENERADQLVFPLEKPSMKVHTTSELTRKFQPYTPLEKEIATLLHGSEHVLPEKAGLTKSEQRALRAMDIEEARQRRAELQKHRALVSYKEARAKRQKKIKSKQFHRILNKERRKQEEKALDELEDKDPELLKSKIDKAEKNRIQERMSLKHHGGSKKMKQKLVYAKFDKEARLQIDDMLQKSRDLRQKRAQESDSEDDATPVAMSEAEPEKPKKFSPWTNSTLEGPLNPWLEPTKETVKTSRYSMPKAVVAPQNDVIDVDDDGEDVKNDVTDDIRMRVTSVTEEVYVIDDLKAEQVATGDVTDKSTQNELVQNENENGENDDQDRDEIDQIFDTAGAHSQAPKKKKKSRQKKSVDPVGKRKESKKENSKKSGDEKLKGKKRKSEDVSLENEVDESGLTISTERKRTLDDMDELAVKSSSDAVDTACVQERADMDELAVKSWSDAVGTACVQERAEMYDPATNIYVDPNNYIILPHKHLTSRAAPLVAEGVDNDDEDVSQHELIAEAFADDDVMDEFSKEKAKVVDRDQPKPIDLTLPGWGCWGGTNVPIPRKKRRKFLIKPPPSAPRMDEKMKNVIISQSKDTTIAKHQVSWLPSKFKNVHQFEGSIRAPIGRTWNPETSFRDLTKPKVVTHLGTIINPMDASQKFQKQKMKGAPPVAQRNKGKR